jgi:hypothetical protein
VKNILNFFKTVINATFITGILVAVFVFIGIGFGLLGYYQIIPTSRHDINAKNVDRSQPSKKICEGIGKAGISYVNDMTNLTTFWRICCDFIQASNTVMGSMLIILSCDNFKVLYRRANIRLGQGTVLLIGLELIVVAIATPYLIQWLISVTAPLYSL